MKVIFGSGMKNVLDGVVVVDHSDPDVIHVEKLNFGFPPIHYTLTRQQVLDIKEHSPKDSQSIQEEDLPLPVPCADCRNGHYWITPRQARRLKEIVSTR